MVTRGVAAALLAGFSVRVAVMLLGHYVRGSSSLDHDFVGMGLADRPELCTPMTCPRRFLEGAFRLDAFKSLPAAYSGGSYNGQPIPVMVLAAISKLPSPAVHVLRICWALVDIVGALALYALAKFISGSPHSEADRARDRRALKHYRAEKKALIALVSNKEDSPEKVEWGSILSAARFHDIDKAAAFARRHASAKAALDDDNGAVVDDSSSMLSAKSLPGTLCAFYVLNPITFLVWASGSFGAIANAVVLAALSLNAGEINRFSWCGAASAALAVYLEPFFAMPALALFLCRSTSLPSSRAPHLSPISFGVLFLLCFFTLLLIPVAYSLTFRETVQATMRRWTIWYASSPDLTPTVGLYWYFFTEVFPSFQRYFLLVFHVHPFVYQMPLMRTFAHRSNVAAHALVMVYSVLRPFPSLADLSMILSLILTHPLLVRRLRKMFAVAVGISISLALMPVMWHLWIYPGSANANYYYNQTLVYNFFVAMLVLEWIAAAVRREKVLKKFANVDESEKKKVA